jgi:hypothetical protein
MSIPEEGGYNIMIDLEIEVSESRYSLLHFEANHTAPLVNEI